MFTILVARAGCNNVISKRDTLANALELFRIIDGNYPGSELISHEHESHPKYGTLRLVVVSEEYKYRMELWSK
jgi:hypothetical protein